MYARLKLFHSRIITIIIKTFKFIPFSYFNFIHIGRFVETGGC